VFVVEKKEGEDVTYGYVRSSVNRPVSKDHSLSWH
jgi:hypothetical protein